ncbi:MAG: M4 family metallopeptidase, partial [Chloroflexi bacterium]|nr:M4 family metallopeptidase [Chloroflexota bacterium]
ISVHYGNDRTINLIKSDLVHSIDLPLKPKIGPDQASEIAIKDAGRGAEAFSAMKPELFVVDAATANVEGEKPKNYLCWQIGVVYREGKTKPNWIYFVDAITGKVLFRTSAIQTGTGTGYYSHGTALNSEASGGTFRLRDTVTSSPWPVITKPAIHTYDDAGSSSQTLTNYSVDPNDNWDNGGATPSNRADDQREEVDIHRFVSYVINYYHTTHNLNSLNGSGLDIKGHAHNEYLSNNAYWDSLQHQIYFASGDGVNYDFMCPLDVVGHECTHGVNNYFNIVQNYHVETGALNEAIADLGGYFIALGYPVDCPQPWKHGQQYRITGRGRDIADPSRDDADVVHYDATSDTTKYNSMLNGYYPDHYSIRYTGPDDWNHDWGGVHINCTIIAHAVYLMINGGTNRISGVPVTAIGVAPVEQMLFEVISTGLLNNTSNFADFRIAFILACQSLYPENLDYLATVKTAFYAVGIGPDLYIRDTLTDQGVEPGTLSCMSPDIILRRQEADAATLASIGDTTNGSLCETIGIKPLGAEDHYVYFRIFNRGSVPASGTLRVFISPVSTFPTPASWTEVGSYDFPSVSGGGLWVPTAANQRILLTGAKIDTLGTGHFCFIGIIESAVDPAPDRTLISDVTEFHNFISKSNNYAWRNCDIINIPADTMGDTPEVERAFQINGLAGKHQARALEIDTRDMPEGTRIIVWMPAIRMVGIKAFMAQTPKERIHMFKVTGVIEELPADKVQLYPLAVNELAAIGDDLKLAPKAIKARELQEWRPLRVAPGKVTRLAGIVVGNDEKMDIRFMVKFPINTGPRDATLTFRERMKDEAYGQVSYIFRIRNK